MSFPKPERNKGTSLPRHEHYPQIASPGVGRSQTSLRSCSGAAHQSPAELKAAQAAPCTQETQKHLFLNRQENNGLVVVQSEVQVCAVSIKGLMSLGSSSSYANPRWKIHGAFVQVSLQFTSGEFQSLLTQLCFLLLGAGWVAYSQEILHSYDYLIPLGTWNSHAKYARIHSWVLIPQGGMCMCCMYTEKPKLWASDRVNNYRNSGSAQESINLSLMIKSQAEFCAPTSLLRITSINTRLQEF